MPDSIQRQILDAASFAARAHQGQKRKDGVTPYIAHPFRVCLIVRDLFGCDDPRMLLAALLHDTIEDTTTDFDDLEERYGKEVATWVRFLTKDKRLPDDEREEAYIAGLQQAPWQVQVCKLADVYDNLSDSGQQPAEKKARTVERAERYFAALRNIKEPQAQKAIQLVESLLAETRKCMK